ncbi:hypothetical protein [Tenacibaculum sp. 190524A05c]|uniref:Uncharacterized protein n=1 Tax=Tenacibaculum platacis TaxID=3137852 RepID=A0ABM9NSN6_9FLAO
MKKTTLISIISAVLLMHCQDPYNMDILSDRPTLTNDTIIDLDTIVKIDTIVEIDTINVDTIIPPDSLARNHSQNSNDIARITKNSQYYKKSYNELMSIVKHDSN